VSASDLAGVGVLVTGGTSGIGRAIAAAFVEAGACVVLTGRERARAEEAAASLLGEGREAAGIELDVSDESAVNAGVAEAGERLGEPIEVLVNNAGLGVRFINEHYLAAPQPFWEIAPEPFRQLLETNIDGYFLCSRAVVPQMLAAGRGRIINISINEATMSRAHFIPYGPSRAASDAMTLAMAAELAGSGVTVNLLAPGGATATGMITDEASPDFRRQLLDPAIMGPPACWLASSEAASINGQKLIAKDFGTAWGPVDPRRSTRPHGA
jgi:NAD(P)-dependent dehydrogenase (short-subunit alcohol dehydrogenase family)